MNPVIVVGAGISGVACARVIKEAHLPVRILDRGHRIAGRMASPTVEGRPVDIGASYVTARTKPFRELVHSWVAEGFAREWTDTFHLATPDGLQGTTTGPMRYAAPHGLRRLVERLADSVPIVRPFDVQAAGPGLWVDGQRASAVVLAMPDPQALDLLSTDLVVERRHLAEAVWQPSMTLYAGWDARRWREDFHGAFVAESPVLAWVADDGRRHGDGAPVLVAHSTPEFAAAHLDDPEAACLPMLQAVCAVLGIRDDPRWVRTKRWSLARPVTPHAEPFLLTAEGFGFCGDSWVGSEEAGEKSGAALDTPRVEAAYGSGRALGHALVARFG